jgi:nucleotide-binding universal stress UspA family protein
VGISIRPRAGRVAFDLDGEIAVLPMNHTMIGMDVCFRALGDSKIQVAVDQQRVAFEADGYDAGSRTGWSPRGPVGDDLDQAARAGTGPSARVRQPGTLHAPAMRDNGNHDAPPSAEADLGEVVAGMTNDGSASDIAAAAVKLARELGAGVRFVQVLSSRVTGEARADAESATFAAALRALHGRPRVRATFEAPWGDPGKLLVDRSLAAMGLVVGADQPHLDHDGTVAAYCLAHARCPVHVVDFGDE